MISKKVDYTFIKFNNKVTNYKFTLPKLKKEKKKKINKKRKEKDKHQNPSNKTV
jgi:hypothetical protein